MSIEKKINIHIRNVQTDRNNETNTIAFYTEALLHEKERSSYITYKESEVSGMEGTTTTLKISEEQVELIRFGTLSSKLSFIKGKATNSLYRTQYGTFDLRIFTEDLKIDIKNNRQSSIHIRYNLDINGEFAYTQELSVIFQP